MLHDFITTHRPEIIERCRGKIATRPAPRPTDAEIEHGVPLFLDQLTETLREAPGRNPEIGKSAVRHARELRERGFTVGQVVHDYGNICQSITELAVEINAPISAAEFRTLNLSLDDAIADAVTEYSRLREHDGMERLGRLSHEMRDLLHRAALAFDVIKSGTVAIGGSTAAVLGRSLAGMAALIDRELADVRLEAKLHHAETFLVRDLLEDIEVTASLEAKARGHQFSISSSADETAYLRVDRQIIESVLGNLLQNAFKFTHTAGRVRLEVQATESRVSFEVHDECGGLPTEKVEELFRPFEQRGHDRRGLGLGLAISHQGAAANGGEIRVANHPGEGCVFILDLPLHRT